MNAGSVLAVVLSTGVLLLALVVATAVVLRAVRAGTDLGRRNAAVGPAGLQGTVWDVGDLVSRLERSVRLLMDMDTQRFERAVYVLADLQPALTETFSRLAEAGVAGGPTEVTESRIVAELNHALQTPLRGLGYAFQNLANLPDDMLLQERAKRVAEMTAMLDSCTSTLATFRGLVDRVASVPARQPSLHDAVRAFGDSIQQPSGDPVAINLRGLLDRVEGFSNHYLLTLLQPLVENAIEGCVPGGTVDITFTDHGDAVEFDVFNPVDHPVDKDVLFGVGRTTKEQHQGLGVSIVERLTDFARGNVSADITDTGVRMRVLLPRR